MFRLLLTMLFTIYVGTDIFSMSYLASEYKDEDKIKLTVADQKKLGKADKEIQKSIQLKQLADKMYSDNAAKQSDLSAEESEKLNNKALEKQTEALKIQQSADETKYNVYSSKIAEFWNKYKGDPGELINAESSENSGKLNYQSAQDQFKEVDENKDKLVAYSKLSSASDLLSKAVENVKNAFEVYSNISLSVSAKSTHRDQPIEKSMRDTIKTYDKQIPVSANNETENVTNSSSDIYHAVNVGENMTDKFNKFLKEYFPNDFDKYIYNFSLVRNSDIDSVKVAWEKYLQREKNKNNLNGEFQVNEHINKADNSKSKVVSNSGLRIVPTKNIRESGKQKNTDNYKNKIFKTFSDRVFTFKVQIVACRVPLNSEFLKEIYSGLEQFEELYENEWYKYSIGQFNTYESAGQLRDKCGVKGAFIIGYLNGKKIKLD